MSVSRTRCILRLTNHSTPPEYTGHFVREQTRKFLWRDYELDYHVAKKGNGGKVPGVSEVMLARCFQDGRCNLDPVPND